MIGIDISNNNKKMKTAFITLFIVILISVGIMIPQTYADELEWKTLEVVGKHKNSDPPVPDQIFFIQYRVFNGTLESINGTDERILVVANTTRSGLLELKLPRNFPYTNTPTESYDFGININGYGSWHYYHPEEDIVQEHVREKLLNKINRPPPYPETYSEKTDCYFLFSIPFYTYAEIQITYAVNALIDNPYHGDQVPQYCLSETTVIQSTSQYPTPLKQFRAGIPIEEIKCKENLVLAIKTSNMHPACVKQSTLEKLYWRGWGNCGWNCSHEIPENLIENG